MQARDERFKARMSKLEEEIKAATADANEIIQKGAAQTTEQVAELPEGPEKKLAAILSQFDARAHGRLVTPLAEIMKFLGADAAVVDKAVAHLGLEKTEPIFRCPFKDMAAVKPIKNPNRHNYPLGEIAVVVFGDTAVRWVPNDGVWMQGNHLPNDPSCYTPVTEEEVRELFDRLDTFPIIIRDNPDAGK